MGVAENENIIHALMLAFYMDTVQAIRPNNHQGDLGLHDDRSRQLREVASSEAQVANKRFKKSLGGVIPTISKALSNLLKRPRSDSGQPSYDSDIATTITDGGVDSDLHTSTPSHSSHNPPAIEQSPPGSLLTAQKQPGWPQHLQKDASEDRLASSYLSLPDQQVTNKCEEANHYISGGLQIDPSEGSLPHAPTDNANGPATPDSRWRAGDQPLQSDPATNLDSQKSLTWTSGSDNKSQDQTAATHASSSGAVVDKNDSHNYQSAPKKRIGHVSKGDTPGVERQNKFGYRMNEFTESSYVGASVAQQHEIVRLGEKHFVSAHMPIPEATLSLWQTGLRESLTKALEHSSTSVNDREAYAVAELHMAGRRRDQLQPHIIITCCTKAREQELRRLLKDMKWLQRTEIRLMLILDESFDYRGNASYNVDDFNLGVEVVVRFQATCSYGILARFEESVQSSRSISSAKFTIGGVIMVGDQIYGLTVAHPVFIEGISVWRQPAESVIKVLDMEYFDTSSSGDNDDDENHNDVSTEIRCRKSHHLENDNKTSENQVTMPSNSDRSTDSETVSEFRHFGQLSRFALDESNAQSGPARSERALVNEGQDWALVKPGTLIPHTNWFKLPGDSNTIEISHVVTLDQVLEGPVWVLTNSGPKAGVLKSLLVPMQLGISSFDTQMITLDGGIVPGDSGAWVSHQGRLCGTIIAGRSTLPWAYMLPIAKTFRGITNFFDGLEVRLPRQFETPDSVSTEDHLGIDQLSKQSAAPETPAIVHDKRKPSQRDQRIQESEASWRGRPIAGNSRPVSRLLATMVLANSIICSADATKVATIQGAIIEEFEQISQLVWLGLAYVLAYAITLPIWDRAYRSCNIDTAILLYVVHSFTYAISDGLFGLSGSMNALLAGRVIVAIGSSGMHSGAEVMASNLLSRSRVLTRQTSYPRRSALPIAQALGLMGGSLGGCFIANNSTSWRWAFYSTALWSGFFTVVFGIFVLRATAKQELIFGRLSLSLHSLQKDYESFDKWARNMDNYLREVLLIGILCFCTVALVFGGSRYAWNSGTEVALWAIAVAAVFLYMILIPGKPVNHRSMTIYLPNNLDSTILQGISFTGTGVFTILVYYMPIFFQFTVGMTAHNATLLVLLFTSIPFIIFILIAFLESHRRSQPLDFAICGLLCVVGGVTLLIVVSNFNFDRQIFAPVVLGTGLGFLYVSRSEFSHHLKVLQKNLPPSAKFPRSLPSESSPPLPPSSSSLRDDRETTRVLQAITTSQCLGAVIALAAAATIYQNFSIRAVRPLLSDPRFLPYLANISSPGNNSNGSGVALDFIVGNSSKAFGALTADFQEALLDALAPAFLKVWFLVMSLAGAAACLTVGLVVRVLLLRHGTQIAFLRRPLTALLQKMQWSAELKAMMSARKKATSGWRTWGVRLLGREREVRRRRDSDAVQDIELAEIPR